VHTGEVLLTTAVSKTIYSTAHNIGVLRFVEAGTRAVEFEQGESINEPTTYAVRVAIEQAVYETIIAGERRGLWRFKQPRSTEEVNSTVDKK
jgi:curli production assembly/transport component CsgG